MTEHGTAHFVPTVGLHHGYAQPFQHRDKNLKITFSHLCELIRSTRTQPQQLNLVLECTAARQERIRSQHRVEESQLCTAVQHSTVQYSTCITSQHSTLQHSLHALGAMQNMHGYCVRLWLRVSRKSQKTSSRQQCWYLAVRC